MRRAWSARCSSAPVPATKTTPALTSSACEEDSYLLELVRYIHLNPIRAGLVSTLNQLNDYQWSGHAVVMGHSQLQGQHTDEVLLLSTSTGNVPEKNTGPSLPTGSLWAEGTNSSAGAQTLP